MLLCSLWFTSETLKCILKNCSCCELNIAGSLGKNYPDYISRASTCTQTKIAGPLGKYINTDQTKIAGSLDKSINTDQTKIARPLGKYIKH